MPRYDLQPPSRSAQRLNEYQQFQQGQQAQQAAAMQQLGLMFNMSQQEVQQEIARANLEIAKSGQGIAQQELALKTAAQPSEIRSREATAVLNEAIAAGYAPHQAALLADMAAQTEGRRAGTAGVLQENAQRPQAFAAAQAQTAAQTRQLSGLADRIGIENKFAPEMGQLGVEQLRNTVNAQPFAQRNLSLQGDAMEQQIGRNPDAWKIEDAKAQAGIANLSAQTLGQDKLNLDFDRRVQQDAANAAMQLQLGGASIARNAYENIGQDIQNQYMPKMYQGQQDLNAAQANSVRANTGINLTAAGLVNPGQGAELAVPPEYYNTKIAPVHAETEKRRAAFRAGEEGRPAISPQNYGIPPEYAQDQEIAALLLEQQRKQQEQHNYYRKGGELSAQVQRDRLNRQVHPVRQGIKDLWTLFQ